MAQVSAIPAEGLRRLSTEQLLVVFGGMEAPAMEEMDGEYAAELLRQPSLFAAISGAVSVSNPLMPWLCKAFRPVDAGTGRGYNTFRIFGRVVQRYPMQTLIAPSRFDGKPAYQLVYRAYQSLCGDIHMVDEVRRAAPGVYLGIGTWGYTERQRQVPLPFMLEGPKARYRGDVGRRRAGFVVNQELKKTAY
ncbi:hypothetical protein [Hydrocarboniclastica marina]|uniref:Uncharacterized protein n=1 Tax=Hydrocarboniclastica marina TaxID=2259620 RepID=A0A4P7XF15_9ALTE|nr:hypothetical protein [Hydrocarboniclastica marina]QCF25476.1 hypothetical protein soil367_05780 [Hydrocarboniclastica marina]